jgi:hypothetical protein
MVVIVLPVRGSSKIRAWPVRAISNAPSTWYGRGVNPSGTGMLNAESETSAVRTTACSRIHSCRRGPGFHASP